MDGTPAHGRDGGGFTEGDQRPPPPPVLSPSLATAHRSCKSPPVVTSRPPAEGLCWCWAAPDHRDGPPPPPPPVSCPADCRTIAGAEVNLHCVADFNYGAMRYHGCSLADDTRPWCATQTLADGSYSQGHWGYCNAACVTGVPPPPPTRCTVWPGPAPSARRRSTPAPPPPPPGGKGQRKGKGSREGKIGQGGGGRSQGR